MEMEQIQLNAQVDLIQSSDPNGSNDEFSFDDELMEYEEEIKDDPQVLLNLKNHIEKLKDHGMDLMVDKEAPMQMLNLIFKQQHQNVLEGQLTEDVDYVDQIKYYATNEDVQIQQRMGKDVEAKLHLYPFQMTNDLTLGGRCVQIKAKMRLDESLNEEHRKQLWELLEEY